MKSVKPKRDVRIFDFGVGYDVNTRLLNQLAAEHHGTAQYIEPSESLEVALSNFYQKIKSPVLSDVKIAYDGIQVKDVYPKEVKDIFAGQQVLLIGRYKGEGKASLKLSGRLNGETKEYAFPVEFAKEDTGHSYLPRIWAMRRIGYLTDVAHANDESKEVVDEIIALSQKYGIISAYTSYLVTDPSENNGSFRRQNIPGAVSFGGAARPSFRVDETRVRGGLVPPPPPVVPMGMSSTNLAKREAGSAARFHYSKVFSDFDHKAESGQKAVLVAKTLNELKESNAIDKQDLMAGEMKTVEDKTFYMVSGFWTESTFKAKAADIKVKEIKFNSDEYFALMKSVPGITKFLSVGKQVIVEFNGTWYKIVQPGDATG